MRSRAGLGLVVAPITSSLLGSVDRARSGIASGTLNSLRQTGSVIGVALFGSLIADGSHIDQGLHLALSCSIVLLLVATLAVSCIKARSDQRRRSFSTMGPRQTMPASVGDLDARGELGAIRAAPQELADRHLIGPPEVAAAAQTSSRGRDERQRGLGRQRRDAVKLVLRFRLRRSLPLGRSRRSRP